MTSSTGVPAGKHLPSPEWVANQRFGLAPAPHGLALVQDFLNTREHRTEGPDMLGDGVSAQSWADAAVRAWSARTGRSWEPPLLSDGDAVKLREFRDALDTGFQHQPTQQVTANVDFFLDEGELDWLPTGSDWQWLCSVILIEIFIGRHVGTWRRIKQCGNGTCRAAFYDRSSDLRETRHNIRTCGIGVASPGADGSHADRRLGPIAGSVGRLERESGGD
jgi:hypothetical protein